MFGIMGGSALLMYGVDKMGKGLENAGSKVLKKFLVILTGRVWSAFLVGTFLTALLPRFVHYLTFYFEPDKDISAQIANSHTIFNLLSAVVFLPFTKYYVRFIEYIV